MTNLGDCAIAIIGHRFYQQGDAARTISFIRDFLVGPALFRAGAAADGPIDRVVGHVAGLGVENGLAQARVSVGIPPASARRDRNFLDRLGEKFAALGVSRALLVLDAMPLRMSGHSRGLP